MTIAALPELDATTLTRKVFLTAAEAALYLDFTSDSYRDPAKAFHAFVVRHGIPRRYAGRRLRFSRRDLDQAMGQR